ncbi:MAG: DNA polymerase III subunit delta [Deltaproteobacteria bacterium]
MREHPQVFLFYGNQDLLINEQVLELTNKILPSDTRDLGFQRFSVEEILKGSENEGQLSELIQSLESLPFLEESRVVRLDNIERIKAPRSQSDKSKETRLYNAVLNFLNSPLEKTFLVLCSQATRENDFSKPLLNACKKSGRVRKFVAYDNDQPIEWTRQRALGKGLRIPENVAIELIQLVGNNLNDLDHELEKLHLLFGTDSVVEANQISKFVKGHKHYSVYALSESISKKELAQSLEFLETHLKENPRDGVKLFGVLTSQVRRLLLVKYFLHERLSETEIFSKLRIHPFLGRQLLQNTKGFTLTELENIQVHLAEIDLSIKFQQQHVRPLFQNLLEKICLGHFQFSPVRV